MRFAKFITIFALIVFALSCSSSDSSQINETDEIKPIELTQKEKQLLRLEKTMHYLVIYGEEVDDELIQGILLEYLDNGTGFGIFGDYCFDLEVGNMPPDLCRKFTIGLIEGNWSAEFKDAVLVGRNPVGTMKVVIFLYRSLESDYPDLAKQFLDHFLDLINQIEIPISRAFGSIISYKYLYLAGFSGMKIKMLDAVQLLMDIISKGEDKITPVGMINQVAEIASVDYETAMMLAQTFFDDEYYLVESKAAIAGGLMKSDYEHGLQLYLEAVEEIVKLDYNPEARKHIPFEFAYTNLREEDKKKYAKKHFDVMNHYKRVEIMPPLEKFQLKLSEPVLPSWFRDQLFEWINSKFDYPVRIESVQKKLIEHCSRYPKSHNTEIYIGWLLDWIEKLDSPFEKYIYLGRLLTTANAVIPDNISIAKPKFDRIINSFKTKLPDLDLEDSLLGVLFFEEPGQFKNNLGDGSIIADNNEFITSFIGVMQYRHYFHPDNDAGLGEIITELAENTERSNLKEDFDIYKNLAAMWAGWDDDRAWEMIESLDRSNGEFPKSLIIVAIVTKPYAPGFAARCIDDLMESYSNWEFNLSNPNLETNLVSSLSMISIQWAEQLADVIIEHRGETDPAFSFYNLRADILRSAFDLNAGKDELARITYDIQNKLRVDFNLESDYNDDDVNLKEDS